MITARNRSFGDDRKMEDPGLEEGEAHSYHDNDHGFDDGIDPDVSLHIVRSFYLYLYLFLLYTLN